MADSIYTQGLTAARNSLKTLVSHVGLSTDQTAFSLGQTAVDPANGGASNLIIKASTEADVDATTFDATISINGDTEFTNKTIFSISLMNGPTRTEALSRTVRSQGIGVQAGDNFTIGPRVAIEDNS